MLESGSPAQQWKVETNTRRAQVSTKAWVVGQLGIGLPLSGVHHVQRGLACVCHLQQGRPAATGAGLERSDAR